MKPHKSEMNFNLSRNQLSTQAQRTAEALKSLEQTAEGLLFPLETLFSREPNESKSVAEKFESAISAFKSLTAERRSPDRLATESTNTHRALSLSPPNGERAGVRGQFERLPAGDAFSSELIDRLAHEFNTRTLSGDFQGQATAPPISSLERMGFVFNSGGGRADDHARNTAENTRKTVLLLERLERKNPAAGENAFNHLT